MKAYLSFNLKSEDDRNEFKAAVKANSMYCALWTFSQDTLRQIRKYEQLDEKQQELIERIEQEFYDTLRNNGVDLDELA